MLMFGRNPRLPIDAALGLRENQQDITTTFITELKDRISKAHEVTTAARWSDLVRPSLFSFLTLNTGIPSLGWLKTTYGSCSHLSANLCFPSKLTTFTSTPTTFITELKDRISKAHEVATAATNKAARKQKDNYDNKVRGGTVQVGDRVPST
jgi:hypothetical protein